MLCTLRFLVDEQDEYVRQIDDLKKKIANKQSEVDHLKREVTEMKNVARSATRVSTRKAASQLLLCKNKIGTE